MAIRQSQIHLKIVKNPILTTVNKQSDIIELLRTTDIKVSLFGDRASDIAIWNESHGNFFIKYKNFANLEVCYFEFKDYMEDNLNTKLKAVFSYIREWAISLEDLDEREYTLEV